MEMLKLDSVFLKIWQFSPHPFNCKKVGSVQLSSNFLPLLSLIAIVITLMCEIWTCFLKKHVSKVGIVQRRKTRLWKTFNIS